MLCEQENALRNFVYQSTVNPHISHAHFGQGAIQAVELFYDKFDALPAQHLTWQSLTNRQLLYLCL